MNKYLLVLFSVTIFQCTTNDNEVKNHEDSIKVSAVIPSPKINANEDSIRKVESDEENRKYNDYVANTLEELRRSPGSVDTSNVPSNPRKLIATFDEAGLGDYFHLSFTDANGNDWDFGSGDNKLNNYEFYISGGEWGDDASNLKLKGKKFEITWDSLTNIYECCSGEMHVVKGRVPTILDLKLME